MLRNNDLITLFDVRKSLTPLHVSSGDARNRRETDSRLASGGGNAPLGASEFAELGADSVHHLVELDKVVRRLEHGLLHLRKRPGSANDGKRAAAVDKWAHTDPSKEIVLISSLLHGKCLLRL